MLNLAFTYKTFSSMCEISGACHRCFCSYPRFSFKGNCGKVDQVSSKWVSDSCFQSFNTTTEQELGEYFSLLTSSSWLCLFYKHFSSTPQKRSNVPVTQATTELLSSSACLGADCLMKLLGNYCRNLDIKTAITVGVVGKNPVGSHIRFCLCETRFFSNVKNVHP